MHGHHVHRGFFAGILHAVAVFSAIGGIFLAGCWVSIKQDPLGWIHDFWLPAALLLAGLVGMIRSGLSKGEKR